MACPCNRCGNGDPAAIPAPLPLTTGGMTGLAAVSTVTLPARAFPWWLVVVIVLLLVTRKE